MGEACLCRRVPSRPSDSLPAQHQSAHFRYKSTDHMKRHSAWAASWRVQLTHVRGMALHYASFVRTGRRSSQGSALVPRKEPEPSAACRVVRLLKRGWKPGGIPMRIRFDRWSRTCWGMGLGFLLVALGGCGGVAGAVTRATTGGATPPTSSAASSSGPTPPPAGAVTVRISEGQGWRPPSVSIAPTQAVVWENDDPTSAHPVECVPAESSGACPWSGALALPAARRDASGALIPSQAQAIFRNPGTFTFRDAAHPALRGQVVVGAPGRPASPTPTR
jgi:hypothetical protein